MSVLGACVGVSRRRGGGGSVLDHFATILYTENNSFPRTIATGVDVREGLVWHRPRTGVENFWAILPNTLGSTFVYDSLSSNVPLAASSFSASATTVSFSSSADIGLANSGSTDDALWCFKRQAGFMDTVRYTGNGSNRTIAHNLGIAPGAIIIKRLDSSAGYQVGHRGLSNWGNYIALNSNATQFADATIFNSTAPDASVFSLGTSSTVNANSGQYVAHLFAHDTGVNGLIQCATYTGNGSVTGPIVTLGWQPRFLLVKNRTTVSRSWVLVDTARTPDFSGSEEVITVNNSTPTSSDAVAMTADGFQIVTTGSNWNTSGAVHIVIAIR